MRRAFYVLLAVSATLAAPSLPSGADEAAEPASAASRDFRLSFRTVVPRPSGGPARVEVWVPLPLELGVQRVRELAVQAPIPYEVTHDKATGNRMVHVLIEHATQEVAIRWTAIVSRETESGQEDATPDASHLAGDRLAPVDDKARELAHCLKLDDPRLSTRERAKIIFDHVVAQTQYDKLEPGWGTGDFERVCRVGKGNCSDFSARFITLTRAAGIPARWVSSIALSEDHVACDACGYHCYAHYFDGGHWIPVDPSEARRALGTHPDKATWLFGHAERSNVILSVGRDLTLSPRQRGPAINYLAGPYVEIDGKPVPLEPKNRSYEFAAL